ncbi:hypothetical protein Hypma_005810 [Hypsizygus marmoreus]|uniref:Uncharacterized protein n=1 Tax=Hypsizygus marmoreus TaxID=39966 RepID=A0A369KAL4_HYPMA|nr:hypothetical protein Hypma_005810 [Hypsizygus marmoreus]
MYERRSRRLEVVFSELNLAVDALQAAFGRPISHLVFLDQLPQRRTTEAGKVSLALPHDLSQWAKVCRDLSSQTTGRESLCEIAISHITQLRCFLLERTKEGNVNVDLDPRVLSMDLETAVDSARKTCNDLLSVLYTISGDVPAFHPQGTGAEENMIHNAIRIAKHKAEILDRWEVAELESIIQHLIVLQKVLLKTLPSTNAVIRLLGEETCVQQATLDVELKRSACVTIPPCSSYRLLLLFLSVVTLLFLIIAC